MAYWASNLLTGTSTQAAAITAAPTFRRPATTAAQAGQIVHERAVFTQASGVNLATNDVVELLILPAFHVPVDFAVSYSQFDSSTGSLVKIGVMTGAPFDVTRALATVGEEILPATAQSLRAAGAVRHGVIAANNITAASVAAFAALGAAAVDRSIGLGVVAQATTDPSTTRILTLDLWYKSAN